jgi:hypothetical protein
VVIIFYLQEFYTMTASMAIYHFFPVESASYLAQSSSLSYDLWKLIMKGIVMTNKKLQLLVSALLALVLYLVRGF